MEHEEYEVLHEPGCERIGTTGEYEVRLIDGQQRLPCCGSLHERRRDWKHAVPWSAVSSTRATPPPLAEHVSR